MTKKRYKLRDLDIDRVDLVDRGANQHADIVIAKGLNPREQVAKNMKEGYEDTQLKNGPPPVVRNAPKKKKKDDDDEKKKKKKGTPFPERNAAESSTSAGAMPVAKHTPGGQRHDQSAHGRRGSVSRGYRSASAARPSSAAVAPHPGASRRQPGESMGAWENRIGARSALVSDYLQSAGGTRGRFDGFATAEDQQVSGIADAALADRFRERQEAGRRSGPPSEPRPLWSIAEQVRSDWGNVNFAAKPYLDAMSSMGDINSNFGQDDGRSVVAYFLSNARSWTGPVAREVKSELKAMLDTPDIPDTRPGATREEFATWQDLFQKAHDKGLSEDKDTKDKDLPHLNDVKLAPRGKASKDTKGKPDAERQESPDGEGLGLDDDDDRPGGPPLGPGTPDGKRPIETPKPKQATPSVKPDEKKL